MESKKQVAVGIFMPAYNQGKYIEEALESLKKQTFQDFVVHIVDDGSTDGVTPEILGRIKYEKATIFPSKVNKGVAFRAREHFRTFDTKYVLVFCADDILAPEFLEKTVNCMEKNPECGIVSTNIFVFSDDYKNEIRFDKKKMTLPYMLSRCYCFGSSLMRKEALDKIDFSGGFTRYQDWDRYTTMIEDGWKAKLIEEPLFYYRQLYTSLSHTLPANEEVDIRKKMLKKHAKYYKQYYETVILDMQYHYSEMRVGKDWLDKQYHSLNKEVKRLNEKVSELEEELEKRRSMKYYLKKRIAEKRKAAK